MILLKQSRDFNHHPKEMLPEVMYRKNHLVVTFHREPVAAMVPFKDYEKIIEIFDYLKQLETLDLQNYNKVLEITVLLKAKLRDITFPNLADLERAVPNS